MIIQQKKNEKKNKEEINLIQNQSQFERYSDYSGSGERMFKL